MALANACIWFGIAHRLHGNLLISYYQLGMVAGTCQDQRRRCLFTSTFIFVAREGRCLQWPHLAKSLGQAANFEVQLTTTTQQQHNFAFYAASTCTWELCSGGGDLLEVQPGHSTGPRKLWNAGALTCVIHPYLLVSFTYNELLFNLHLFQDDGEPEGLQSVQGSQPLYCRIATVRHPGIQAGPVRSVTAHSGLHGLALVVTSLDL